MNYLNTVKAFLSGRKTYIVAGLMVLVSLVNLAVGDITAAEFITSENLQLVLEGLGLGFLRAGIAKGEQ